MKHQIFFLLAALVLIGTVPASAQNNPTSSTPTPPGSLSGDGATPSPAGAATAAPTPAVTPESAGSPPSAAAATIYFQGTVLSSDGLNRVLTLNRGGKLSQVKVTPDALITVDGHPGQFADAVSGTYVIGSGRGDGEGILIADVLNILRNFHPLAARVHKTSPVSLKVRTGLFSQSGQSFYDITFSGVDPTYGPSNYESRLTFNLNDEMWGLGGDLVFGNDDFILSVDDAFSIGGDGENFQDQDWYYNGTYDSQYGDVIGDTNSTGVETPAMILDIALKPKLADTPGHGFQMFADLDYEIEHWGTFNVYNFAGTYGPYLTGDGTQPVSGTYPTPALTYEINYDTFYVGLDTALWLAPGWKVGLGAKVGAESYSDIDNHILRLKQSEGRGGGLASDFTGEMSLQLGDRAGLNLKCGIENFSGTGSMTENYYGGPYNGQSVTVNETVGLNQFNIGLEFVYLLFGNDRAPR